MSKESGGERRGKVMLSSSEGIERQPAVGPRDTILPSGEMVLKVDRDIIVSKVRAVLKRQSVSQRAVGDSEGGSCGSCAGVCYCVVACRKLREIFCLLLPT